MCRLSLILQNISRGSVVFHDGCSNQQEVSPFMMFILAWYLQNNSPYYRCRYYSLLRVDLTVDIKIITYFYIQRMCKIYTLLTEIFNWQLAYTYIDISRNATVTQLGVCQRRVAMNNCLTAAVRVVRQVCGGKGKIKARYRSSLLWYEGGREEGRGNGRIKMMTVYSYWRDVGGRGRGREGNVLVYGGR